MNMQTLLLTGIGGLLAWQVFRSEGGALPASGAVAQTRLLTDFKPTKGETPQDRRAMVEAQRAAVFAKIGNKAPSGMPFTQGRVWADGRKVGIPSAFYWNARALATGKNPAFVPTNQTDYQDMLAYEKALMGG